MVSESFSSKTESVTTILSKNVNVLDCRVIDSKNLIFSRGHATLHLAVLVGPSVRRSIRPSVTFLNSKQFLRYCSCPTIRDWIAVYPALLPYNVPVTSISQFYIHGRPFGSGRTAAPTLTTKMKHET